MKIGSQIIEKKMWELMTTDMNVGHRNPWLAGNPFPNPKTKKPNSRVSLHQYENLIPILRCIISARVVGFDKAAMSSELQVGQRGE